MKRLFQRPYNALAAKRKRVVETAKAFVFPEATRAPARSGAGDPPESTARSAGRSCRGPRPRFPRKPCSAPRGSGRPRLRGGEASRRAPKRAAVSSLSRPRPFPAFQRPRFQAKRTASASSSSVLAPSRTKGIVCSISARSVDAQRPVAALQDVGHQQRQPRGLGQADVVVVEVVELGPVEPGRAPTTSLMSNQAIACSSEKISSSPWPPAELGQVVAHGLGQVAHLGELADRLGPVALGELGPVGPVDQRQVRPDRRRPAEPW
jgi:hypothetical protein